MRDKNALLAMMMLRGMTRREAAEAVCFSYSAFNRKLRENRLSEEEYRMLRDALTDGQGAAERGLV